MQYLISFILILIGLLKKDSKLLFYLQFLWCWVLIGFNTHNPDYLNYKNQYDLVSETGMYSSSEQLFVILIYISNLLHLNYQGFLIIISFIGLLLMAKTIKKYTKNVSFVFALFSLYPLLESAIQIKQFLAMSIVIYSIKFLITKGKKYSLYYIISIIVATSIHSSSIYFLIFLLIKHLKSKYIVLTSVMMFGVFFVTLNIYPEIITLIADERIYNQYISSSDMRLDIYKSILLIIWQLCGIIIVLISSKGIIRSESKDITTLENAKFIDLINKINILMLPSSFFYFYTMLFMRLYRSVLPLNYIAIAICITVIIKKGGKPYFIIILFVTYILLTFLYFNIISGNVYEHIFFPIFENNLLF